jgi:drug/metabolite transporter (DMT)-like permease
MMNDSDYQFDQATSGSFWKGIGLALLCHFAYLLFVFELPSEEVRVIGYMMFALLQFAYLFPLAIFYKKREQGRTSNGIIVAGVVSLLAMSGWFAYAVMHGTLPSITRS